MVFISVLLVIGTGEDFSSFIFVKGIDFIKAISEQYLPVLSSTGWFECNLSFAAGPLFFSYSLQD